MPYRIGEIIFKDEEIVLNEGSPCVEITVKNSGDRTVQVCSHYHFFEANSALVFNREDAYGKHLDIPSGTAVRFEPGADKKVTLVPYKGDRKIYGFDGLVMGELDDPDVKAKALAKGKEIY